MRDAFISYASQDKTLADALCNRLEAKGIRCWMAPRDITPGTDWGSSIIEGIKSSKLLVLIFSEASNDSVQVKREVERAVSLGKPVVPFRISDITPSSSLEYFISSAHWLDAITPPVEKHIDRLSEALSVLIAQEPTDASITSSRITNSPAQSNGVFVANRLSIFLVLVGIVVLCVMLVTRNFGGNARSAGSPTRSEIGESNKIKDDQAGRSIETENPTPQTPPKDVNLDYVDDNVKHRSSRSKEDDLYEKITEAVSTLRAWLAENGIREVSVDRLSSRRMPPSFRLENALIKCLQASDVAVASHADHTLTGRYNWASDNDRLSIEINLDLIHRTGKLLTSINFNVSDEREVAILAGITCSFPMTSGQASRMDALVKALSNPEFEIQSDRVFTTDKRYSLEILCDDRPRPATLRSGYAFIEVPQNQTFSIRLTNDAAHEVVSRVTVNGLSTFEFSQLSNRAIEYLIPAKSSVVIPGWCLSDRVYAPFQVGKLPRQRDDVLFSTQLIESISATFAACWRRDEKPPLDEPNPRGDTGIGAQIQSQYNEKARMTGRLRGVVSVRYGESQN